MTKVIVLNSQKGGVGKTTLAAHIVFKYMQKGYRVCAVDLDPQGDLTSVFKNVEGFTVLGAAYDFISNASFEIKETESLAHGLIEGSFLLGAMQDLSQEQVINTLVLNIEKLKRMGFDYIILDTPPSRDIKNIAPLFVATHVIVPFQLQNFSLNGIKRTIVTIETFRKTNNPNLIFLGLIPAVFNRSSPLERDTFIDVIKKIPDFLMIRKNMDGSEKIISIPRTDCVVSCLAQNKPVWDLSGKTAEKAGDEYSHFFDFLDSKGV